MTSIILSFSAPRPPFAPRPGEEEEDVGNRPPPAIPAGATLLSILDVVNTPRPRRRDHNNGNKKPKHNGFDSILGLDSTKQTPNLNQG
jgi:hypothetical protein